MTMRKATPKHQSEVLATPSDLVEEKLLAFAEQLGGFMGTVQTKAPGWLDRTVLNTAIGRIQDSAADLLAHVNREDALQRNTTAKQTAISALRRSRGPVDAPGKRHRKPLPPEQIDRQMGEAEGNRWAKRAPRLEGVADEANGKPLGPLSAAAISYSGASDLISKQQRGRCARSQHSCTEAPTNSLTRLSMARHTARCFPVKAESGHPSPRMT